ncbi:MAG: rod shape-determining protein MreD [Acidobacteriota bacterium]|jgi:rod shape-determining protein MreD|nr:rod shape-determining protein MreD [Acidobacteriota bacterium]
MRRKIKPLLTLLLLLIQISLNRYRDVMHVIPDLLYLVIMYVAVTAGPIRTILVATLLGWVTDFFSAGLVGVFGFSRVISAYLVNRLSHFLDLTRMHFVFFLILISLGLSNLTAGLFLGWIYAFPLETGMLVYQPLLTALLGVVILKIPLLKRELNVH